MNLQRLGKRGAVLTTALLLAASTAFSVWAAPFAALGFITYHGMTAEQFLWAWLRSELLEPKQLTCEPQNLYYELLKGGKGC